MSVKESGVTMIEYALIAALIAVVSIIGISATGNAATTKFGNISNAIGSTDSGNTPLPDPTPSAPGSTTVYASSYSINGADGTAEYLAITKDQRTLDSATIDGMTYSLTQIEAPHDVSAGGACSTTQSANITAAEIVDRVAPTSISYWFNGDKQLKEVEGWTDNIDASTSSATDMSYTFNGCTALAKTPTIPSGITNITRAFYGCCNLTVAPVIPNSVTNMSRSFYMCNAMVTPPSIPDSVTDMSYAFGSCISLTSAPSIPSSVETLYSSFINCTNISKGPDVIPASVTKMFNAFSGCSSLTGNMTIFASPEIYTGCFTNASTASGASLTVNYGASATNIDDVIATKSAGSHIVKGILKS